VTFDNTYSMLRSKKIHYSIYVTKKLNLLPTDDDVAAILDEPIDSKDEGIGNMVAKLSV